MERRALGDRLVTLAAGYASTVRVSPDDRRVGLARWEKHDLSLCELATGRAAQSVRVPGTNAIADAAFSPDSRWLACATLDAVWLLDAESTAPLVAIPATKAASVCFDPVGETLYIGTAHGLFAWPIRANVRSNEVIVGPARRLGSASPVRLVRSSPRGKIVATAHENHCQLFNVHTGREVETDAVDGSYIWSLSFSPDGRWLAAGGWQGRQAKIWDASSGQLIQMITDLDSPRVSFSPDGLWLLASDANDYIVYETRSWKPMRRIPSDGFAVTGFCPATGALAVRAAQTTLRLVDPATSEVLAVLEPPGVEHFDDFSFSSDGGRLAVTRPQAHDLLLWDIRAIRAELKRMKLDWAGPALPPMPARLFQGTNYIVDTTSPEPGGDPQRPELPSKAHGIGLDRKQ